MVIRFRDMVPEQANVNVEKRNEENYTRGVQYVMGIQTFYICTLRIYFQKKKIFFLAM